MAGKPKKRHPVTQPLDKPYRLIALTQQQNALVDAKYFEWLSKWNWFANWNPGTRSFYAARTIQGENGCKKIYMHKQILNCRNKEGDHRNLDTLDNRMENLRKATRSQNASNTNLRANSTSGYIGVSWHKHTEKWRSQIRHKKMRVHLGLFASPVEAAHAYDEAAKKYHGEFAYLNFPE